LGATKLNKNVEANENNNYIFSTRFKQYNQMLIKRLSLLFLAMIFVLHLQGQNKNDSIWLSVLCNSKSTQSWYVFEDGIQIGFENAELIYLHNHYSKLPSNSTIESFIRAHHAKNWLSSELSNQSFDSLCYNKNNFTELSHLIETLSKIRFDLALQLHHIWNNAFLTDIKLQKVSSSENLTTILYHSKGAKSNYISLKFLDSNKTTQHITSYPDNIQLVNQTEKNTLLLKNFNYQNELLLESPGYMIDVNPLNNGFSPKLDFRFSKYKLAPHSKEYTIQWQPEMAYNAYDGIKLGAGLYGGFLNRMHVFDAKVFYNLGSPQGEDFGNDANNYRLINWNLNYTTALNSLNPNTDFFLSTAFLDGLIKHQIGLVFFMPNKKTRFTADIKALKRSNSSDLNYVFDKKNWSTEKWNASINLSLRHNYKWKSNVGDILLHVRGMAPGSEFNYSYIQAESKHHFNGFKLPLHLRFFGQYGFGNNWAPESQLFLAGANPEQQFENPLTRSSGIIPATWGIYAASLGFLHEGGGLNLRGYSAYLAPETLEDGTQIFSYAGNTGASINAELDFQKLSPFAFSSLKKFLQYRIYAFADAGIINTNSPDKNLVLAKPRADAGIGTSFTIKHNKNINNQNPICIRIDFPMWMNRPPAESDFFEFRWLLGLSKTF
jgi:hypothetical protein